MLTDVNRRWLDEFHNKYGRAPRILHIGNIANNAYLNAKFLNEAGFDCDVICYDFYHIMGCPEWEEADFDATALDHFKPDWTSIDSGGFVRPAWFAQGPQMLCIDYLIARRMGDVNRADTLWKALRYCNGTGGAGWGETFLARYLVRIRSVVNTLIFWPDALAAMLSKLMVFAKNNGASGFIGAALLAVPVVIFAPIIKTIGWFVVRFSGNHARFVRGVAKRVEQFANLFPDRADKLSADDCAEFAPRIHKWKSLFEQYDLVQAYATDGVLPLLAEFPYVAFEHGTIRSIPFENTKQGRLCAATYRLANWVIITNADNYIAAQKLQLPGYDFVPHPVSDVVQGVVHYSYDSLHQELDADFVIFHPARQHWDETRHPSWEKGNDFLIKAFAKLVVTTNRRASAVFVEWGQSVEESKRLIEGLGIADRVKWVPPMSHQWMVGFIQASDVVADQFYLGAFGSLMPKSLACGRPAMLYLDPSFHKWCFPEFPPVVNVHSEEEIFAGLERLYHDKIYYQKICDDGRSWYLHWHSRQVIVNKLASIYARVIG